MIICLLDALLRHILILLPVFVFNPKKYGNVCHNVTFLDVTSSFFLSLVPCLKFTLRNVATKKVTDVSLVLKDSDTESENLSSLIRLSESDGQKTDSLYIISFIGIL